MNLYRSLKKRRHALRAWITDPASLKLSEADLVTASKRQSEQSTDADRRAEIQAYYDASPEAIEQTVATIRNEVGRPKELSVDPAFF